MTQARCARRRTHRAKLVAPWAALCLGVVAAEDPRAAERDGQTEQEQCVVDAAAAGSQLYSAAMAAAQTQRLDCAERLLSRRLAVAPNDTDARMLRARVRSWSGRWDGASSDYDALLRMEPGNVDYLLGKAQVLLWSGSADDAALVVRAAREAVPDYEALWRLEIQALLASRDESRREEAGIVAREAQQRFPSSTWSSPLESRRQSRFDVSTGVGRESLSNGFADWSSATVSVAYDSGERRVYGRARRTERFDLDDTELALGAELSLGSFWSGMMELTSSPSGRVLPERSAAAGARRALAGEWGVGASFRHSRYESTSASLVSLSVDRYWRDFNFSYHVYRSETRDAGATLSRAVRAGYYYGRGSSAAIVLARGTELESIGVDRLLRTRVESLSMFGEHRIGADWSLTWALISHEQGALYLRNGFDAGFRRRF
jgi:YaiO family outer membrane protein